MLRLIVNAFCKLSVMLCRYLSSWNWRRRALNPGEQVSTTTGQGQHELANNIETAYRNNMLNIEKENVTIGPEGKRIFLWRCRMSFPPAAVETTVNVNISVVRAPSDYMREELPITPALKCEPELTFNRPVTVEMPTTCGAHMRQEIVASLFCKNSVNEAQWQKDSDIVLKTDYVARFDVSCLSTCVIGVKPSQDCLFRMISCLYIHQKTALIVSFLCWDDAMLRCFRKALENEGFRHFTTSTKHQKFKLGWTLEMQLICEQPKPTLLLSKSKRSYDVTREFLQRMELEHVFYETDPPLLEHEGEVKMKCIIEAREEGKMRSRLTSPLAINWPIEKTDPPTTSSASNDSGETASSSAVSSQNLPSASPTTTFTSASQGAIAAGGNIIINIQNLVLRNEAIAALAVGFLIWSLTKQIYPLELDT